MGKESEDGSFKLHHMPVAACMLHDSQSSLGRHHLEMESTGQLIMSTTSTRDTHAIRCFDKKLYIDINNWRLYREILAVRPKSSKQLK